MLAIVSLPFPNVDPVILRLGPVVVRWYGLAYVTGFAIAYGVLRRLANRHVLRISVEAIGDLMSWLVVGVIVGGRTGWWLFYHRSTGGTEPWYEPIAIWQGGMSFHGGLIGVAIVLLIWSHHVRASFWNMADGLAMVVPIGLFFGRIANFINAELVGRPSNLPWAVVFPGESFARHPSQLYEAVLEGPVLLATVWLYRKQCQPGDGQTAALFLIAYGLVRFAVEFTRQPDEQLGFIALDWLTMGQLLSTALIVGGILLWVWPRHGSRELIAFNEII